MKQSKKPPNSRPGWRGPGKSKSKPKASPAAKLKASPTPSEASLPPALQQQLLHIFQASFPNLRDQGFEALKPILQEIKQALFDRDFERAFGNPLYLEAYAFRWSPSRALCYATVLVELRDYLVDILPLDLSGWDQSVSRDVRKSLAASGDDGFSVTCIGGGAAEVVAFGGFLHYLVENMSSAPSTENEESPIPPIDEAIPSGNPEMRNNLHLHLHLIDLASWSPIISRLKTSLTQPPILSKYASASAIASAKALLPPSALSTSFTQCNILTLDAEKFPSLFTPSSLVTLFFTLNELYSTSLKQTSTFLSHLSASLRRGSLLLIIDSAGTYSTTHLRAPIETDADSKTDLKTDLKTSPPQYPMSWLLDHTLLQSQPQTQTQAQDQEHKSPQWEKLKEESSAWFRLNDTAGLKYSLPLEDMRYQLHLYRRL